MEWMLASPAGRQFLIGGVGCAVLASWMLYFIFTVRARVKSSQGWPSVEGTIVRSEKIIHGQRNRKSFVPRIEYAYTVNDRTYTSRRIGFVNIAGSNETAADIVVERYPQGSKVPVFYSPTSPQYSVLERDSPDRAESGFLWFLCGAFLLSSAVNFYMSWDAAMKQLWPDA